MPNLYLPPGRLSTPSRDDDALRKQREEIRKKLLEGKPVYVEQGSGATLADRPANAVAIQVPPGKLASFYWHETDRDLLEGEKTAMQQFFPQFSIIHAPDGRLAWVGTVSPGLLRGGQRSYILQAVYEHDHPNNDSYGGSIKVYSIDPELEDLASSGPIPHTLRDSAGRLYICTSRIEDFHAGARAGQSVTSAASAIGWAVKWLAVFELWLNGDITDAEFRDHKV